MEPYSRHIQTPSDLLEFRLHNIEKTLVNHTELLLEIKGFLATFLGVNKFPPLNSQTLEKNTNQQSPENPLHNKSKMSLRAEKCPSPVGGKCIKKDNETLQKILAKTSPIRMAPKEAKIQKRGPEEDYYRMKKTGGPKEEESSVDSSINSVFSSSQLVANMKKKLIIEPIDVCTIPTNNDKDALEKRPKAVTSRNVNDIIIMPNSTKSSRNSRHENANITINTITGKLKTEKRIPAYNTNLTLDDKSTDASKLNITQPCTARNNETKQKDEIIAKTAQFLNKTKAQISILAKNAGTKTIKPQFFKSVRTSIKISGLEKLPGACLALISAFLNEEVPKFAFCSKKLLVAFSQYKLQNINARIALYDEVRGSYVFFKNFIKFRSNNLNFLQRCENSLQK